MSDSQGIVRKVAQYCWSHKFLDVFQKYFTDHAYAFQDAPPTLAQGEHNLEYHDLFTKYLKVYEDTLEDYLGQLEIPLDEFHREVAEIQEDSEDPYLKQFVKCLLASADYDSFYRVMAREGRQYKVNYIINFREAFLSVFTMTPCELSSGISQYITFIKSINQSYHSHKYYIYE